MAHAELIGPPAGVLVSIARLQVPAPRVAEGAAAHPWQLPMFFHVPQIVWFVLKRLWKAPRPTLAALAPVYLLG